VHNLESVNITNQFQQLLCGGGGVKLNSLVEGNVNSNEKRARIRPQDKRIKEVEKMMTQGSDLEPVDHEG
jgi:hypothetical protein